MCARWIKECGLHAITAVHNGCTTKYMVYIDTLLSASISGHNIVTSVYLNSQLLYTLDR